jgi:hypothetical protein
MGPGGHPDPGGGQTGKGHRTRALAEPDMREWLAKRCADSMNMTQPEFARFVQSESESAARLIKSAP